MVFVLVSGMGVLWSSMWIAPKAHGKLLTTEAETVSSKSNTIGDPEKEPFALKDAQFLPLRQFQCQFVGVFLMMVP
jgi:hypothetical protein